MIVLYCVQLMKICHYDIINYVVRLNRLGKEE